MSVTPDIQAYISEQIERAMRSRPQLFTAERADVLESTAAAVATMTRDQSLGRVLGGSLWLSGVSVIDGTITADKLTVTELSAITASMGSLNVTGTIQVAATYPATGARIDIAATGIKGYNSTPTQTFEFLTTGAGFIGVGATAMSWTTGGVLTVPAAAIGSLTIANVGSGNLGGTYNTSTANPKLSLAPTFFKAFNAGGTETFDLDATDGSLTITGSFTVLSASTGAHIKIDNAGGIAGYSATTESAANRRFLLNAATGAGHLGQDVTGANPGISWDASGNVSIGGASFSGGKIVAASLSVSTLSAIAADLGTITAGTVTGATIRTSASNPRAEMNTSGFASYDSGGTQRVNLANTGSGWLGASNVITWTTGGTVTISGWTASSSSFTGGSVTLDSGGDITVGSGNNVVRLSTTDASNRFWIGHATSTSAPFRVTSSGAVTIVGTSAFTIESATSGSRVSLSAANGLRIYNAGTLRGELAADGTGFLGSTDGTSANAAISWTTAGTATINATRITAGSLTFGSGGTVNTTGTVAGTLGSINLANLTVTGTITLGSGGKIVDADGSEWAQGGFTLFSAGSLGDSILWKYSGWSSNRPEGYVSTYGSSISHELQVGSVYGNGSSTSVDAKTQYIAAASQADIILYATGDTSSNITQVAVRGHATSTSAYIRAQVHNRQIMELLYTDYAAKFGGRVYPGSSGAQSNIFLLSAGTHMDVRLNDAVGTGALRVLDSSDVVQWAVNSDGQMSLAGSDTTAAGTYAGRVPVAWNGGTKYIHLFNA